ncbi:hypothetical protein [Microbacterium sp.]|uniref:hypothetical protein n=1 Tax=Microbacterium sp. TaxID=51671 RepID=UPI0028122F33|nr:hypothetical protein [Microbacterium sp.]
MAVAATNVALLDLGDDHADAETVSYQLHDTVPLLTPESMIEVEHSDVTSSAVHTGMVGEVRRDEFPALRALRASTRPDDCKVMFPVALVVLSGGLAVAFFANLLESVSAGCLPVEIGQWFKLLAGAASFLCRHLPP